MLRALAPAALLFAIAACTASADQVHPPANELFWPTGMAISPDESTLFVANANSDLRFDSGTVAVVDLAVVDDVVTKWLATHDPSMVGTFSDCKADTDFSETLICTSHHTAQEASDGLQERQPPFIRAADGIRTGSFATAIGLQDKHTTSSDLRLVVPVRGDPSITWVDYDGASKKLVCDDGSAGGEPLCDDRHRLTHLRASDDQPSVSDEPFDVFVDSGNGYAVVTHLTSGTATLVDLPKDADPVLTDAIGGLFGSDPNTGAVGASGVAGRDPGSPGDIVYVASRTEDRIQTFTIARPREGLPALLAPGNFFFLDAVGGQAGNSADSRGLAFGAGGDRMYVINRLPPTVQVYDTSIGPDGTPRHTGMGAADICRQASRMVLADTGDGERAYIACFDTGEVYVVDPRDGVEVVDVIAVGRGPYDLAASPTKRRLYVSNYLDDSISVIDLTPGAATRDRVVLRLKRPT